ncbi:hypothetical protein ACFOYW_04590 [Gryllotalpicola reticulitermitis]|uniref:Antitoxin VbhA domain-containing protein n=1 Tax=Gryllotalpicola reticulitermitis TaxID=1184153 RepID=A0ABV8Q3W2_9MICO
MPEISDEERERRARSVREAAHSGALEGAPAITPEVRVLFGRYVTGELTSSQLVEAVDRWWQVRQAIASSQMERAEPDEETMDDVVRFARGELSSEQVIARTRARYGLPSKTACDDRQNGRAT